MNLILVFSSSKSCLSQVLRIIRINYPLTLSCHQGTPSCLEIYLGDLKKPKFPKSNSPLKSRSLHGSAIRKVPYTHCLLWPGPSPSGSEGNLAFPRGRWIPCSPHAWQPFPLAHHVPTGPEGGTGPLLSSPCHFQTMVSSLISPMGFLEAEAIRLHVPLDPLVVALSHLPGHSHSSSTFPHQVCPFSLPFSYLNGPSNIMASPFLSLFICSGHFLCCSPSATNPVILRPCHLQLYPSVISVSSVLLLYFLHLPSYTSAQIILLLL